MIEQLIKSEFGDYYQKLNHGNRVNGDYATDSKSCKDVEGDWSNCPCCGLRPKAWVFDNRRQTMCGCWNSRYDYFSVMAESIMSVHVRTGGKLMTEYDLDALRKNWNEYCATMINPCDHSDLRIEDKW
jgi:hypothetical protein